jgi:hypothetical protein
LADKTLSFPKIPKKNSNVGPTIQISSAEILEKEEDIPTKELEAQIEQVIEKISDEVIISPELNQENMLKAFALFAVKQKVSIVSLIKLLIPEIKEKQVIVTMTVQQEEFIGEVKIDWQAFLKKYFNDPGITLQFAIDETANTTRKAYTASEQYEETLNESEIFRTMVNKFKLKLKQ